MMKAAVVPTHGRLEVWDIAEPQPGPYDGLVRIDACAICTGTDRNIMLGNYPWPVETPFVLGHESTGLIVDVGERVRNFRPGQRVTRPAGILPGDRRDGVGSNWGGYAQFGLVSDTVAAAEDGVEFNPEWAQSRRPLPQDLDPASGALSVNQREIMSVVARLGLGPDSRVAVIGTGYNGLLFSMFSRHFGAGRVVVVGSPGRERLARGPFEADAFTDYHEESAARSVRGQLGGEPTHVIDAVGTVASVTLAKGLLNPETAFGRYGLHEYDKSGPLAEQIERSHPVLDVSADEVSATDMWYEAWQAGLFERDGMCDGLVPIEEVVEAFGRLERREALKLVLTI